jgi:hypothetical protein
MGKPKLPWKRGPAAWKVASSADQILTALAETHRGFFSLRRAARLLGVSTQPLREWIKRDNLNREGPGGKISKAELCRFVRWLKDRAEPFDSSRYLERLHRKLKAPPEEFDKLRAAWFVWPEGRQALSPKELAQLVGCHPSLVLKAITRHGFFHRLSGRRRTPCRWEVTKHAWMQAFPFTIVSKEG